MKFVRNLDIKLKPSMGPQFTKTVNTEVLPVLNKQPGFAQELAMVQGDNAVAISVWNDKASAEKYHNTTYPKVLEMITPFIEGSPVVKTYELLGNG